MNNEMKVQEINKRQFTKKPRAKSKRGRIPNYAEILERVIRERKSNL